jgi:ubiquinone/menaquinone biosynthesis C-methylase UbiE
MSDKGDAARFDRVDAQNDPAYFVKFLDARKSIPEDALIKRQIIDWLQPLEAKEVLDVGCGTGDDSRELAALVRPKGHVTAIDYSAAMVNEARRRAADSDLPVEFREDDAMKLDFPNGCFDCARAERVLMHLSDARKGLEQMIRVVRSGGRVVASEVDPETSFGDSPNVELMRRLVTSFADANPSPRIGRSLARMMRQSGLQNVKSSATVINLPFGMVRFAVGGHMDKCIQQGLISAQDAAGWWQQLEETNAAGEFHWGAIVFTAIGEKQ